jgi:hypothetical protein
MSEKCYISCDYGGESFMIDVNTTIIFILPPSSRERTPFFSIYRTQLGKDTAKKPLDSYKLVVLNLPSPTYGISHVDGGILNICIGQGVSARYCLKIDVAAQINMHHSEAEGDKQMSMGK